MLVAVECLINVVLERVLIVPAGKRSTKLKIDVVQHQCLAEEVEGTRPRPHRLRQGVQASSLTTEKARAAISRTIRFKSTRNMYVSKSFTSESRRLEDAQPKADSVLKRTEPGGRWPTGTGGRKRGGLRRTFELIFEIEIVSELILYFAWGRVLYLTSAYYVMVLFRLKNERSWFLNSVQPFAT